MRSAAPTILALFLAAATPATADIHLALVAALPSDATSLESIEPLPGGGFVAAWHSRSPLAIADPIRVGVFDSDGTQVAGLDGCVEDPGTWSTWWPLILVLPDDGIVVACEIYARQALSRVTWRAYDGRLIPTGPRFYSKPSLVFAELGHLLAIGPSSFVLHLFECGISGKCGHVLLHASQEGAVIKRSSLRNTRDHDLIALHELGEEELLMFRRRRRSVPPVWETRALAVTARGRRIGRSLRLGAETGLSSNFPAVVTASGRTALLGDPSGIVGPRQYFLRVIEADNLSRSAELRFRRPWRTRDWWWARALPLRDGFLLIGARPWMVQRIREDGRATSDRRRLPGDPVGVGASVAAASDGSFLVGVYQRDTAEDGHLEVWRLTVR